MSASEVFLSPGTTLQQAPLMSLDFDPDVTRISSQPSRITWSTPLPQHVRVPDFFIRHTERQLVTDVRPDEGVKFCPYGDAHRALFASGCFGTPEAPPYQMRRSAVVCPVRDPM